MSLSIPNAERLATTDPGTVLRALSSPDFRADPANAALVRAVDAAADDMERAGPVGLTISLSELILLRQTEGLLGRLFGAAAELYVLTAALDGSGRMVEYRTRSFPGIHAGDRLPLGDGGMVVACMTEPRWFVDFHVVVMESDGDLRALGAAVDAARRETGLAGALDRAASSPRFDGALVASVMDAVDAFLDLLTRLLRANGDDHVATIHDFYLQHQAFGKGRHPASGTRRFQGVDAAYAMDLAALAPQIAVP